MKHKLLGILLMSVLGQLSCFAGPSLLIHLTDSTEIVCALDKEPKMTFSEKSMTLTTVEGMVGQWDFADVESWNFTDVENTAVQEVKAQKLLIRIEDGLITVTGNDAGNVAVFDTDGKKVTAGVKTVDNITTVSIAGFSNGIYLLKAGDSSVKFMVK